MNFTACKFYLKNACKQWVGYAGSHLQSGHFGRLRQEDCLRPGVGDNLGQHSKVPVSTIYMCVCVYIYVCVCVYICMYIHSVCVYVCMCVCVYIYIYIFFFFEGLTLVAQAVLP